MKVIDLRLSQLRHVLFVVEAKSYQLAARRAYRSQPALSQSIRQVELRLGAPLFEKGSRATLTPFGESCVPMIRETVAHMERSLASMRQLADVSGGRLAFAILPSIARQWLPALLREFTALHPGVEVRVLAEDSINVQRMVSEGEVDFGISSAPGPDPKLAFKPLVRDQFGLICRSDHRHAQARTLTWSQLKGESILGSTMHRILEGSSAHALLESPRIYVSNLPTLIALVRDGIGVLPIPAFAYPVGDPGLMLVPLTKPVVARTLGIIAHKDRTLLPSAQAMATLLSKQIARQDWNAWGQANGFGRMIKPVR